MASKRNNRKKRQNKKRKINKIKLLLLFIAVILFIVGSFKLTQSAILAIQNIRINKEKTPVEVNVNDEYEVLQTEVDKNIKQVLEDKKIFKGEKFRYNCPFLINNVCCVYEYRGLVCRSFGLMTNDINGKVQVPFCCFDGLNYSNVMDDEGKHVSREKFDKLGVEEEPTAFNVSYQFLTDPDFERGFNFVFGDKKPLIEWFIKPENETAY